MDVRWQKMYINFCQNRFEDSPQEMSVPPPRGLPRRVLISVRLPDQGGTGTAELVAHRRRALALPPLSPHVAADASGAAAQLGPPGGAPLAPDAPVQRLRPLVHRLAVFVLESREKTRYVTIILQ